jgi:hypothetical protein
MFQGVIHCCPSAAPSKMAGNLDASKGATLLHFYCFASSHPSGHIPWTLMLRTKPNTPRIAWR